jgi:hypothetical protein
MYKILIGFTALVFGNTLFAQQPVIKTYGYSRLVSPGKARVNVKIGDTNPVKEKSLPKTNYYLFIETGDNTDSVICNRLWIKGKRFAVKNQLAVPTPFKLSLPLSEEKTKELVPATANKVIQLWPGKLWKQQLINSRYVKKLVRSNDAVIQVLVNKKIYYIVIRRIQPLPEIAEV